MEGLTAGVEARPPGAEKAECSPCSRRASRSGGACRMSVIPHPGEPELPPGFGE